MKASTTATTICCFGAFVLLSLSTELVRSQTTTKAWAVKPQKGGYAPGNVAGQDSKGHQAEGTVDKGNKQSQMTVAGKGNYNAGQKDKSKAVQATNAKGYQASGDQNKFDPNGNGHQQANYNGAKGPREGDLDNKKNGNDREYIGKAAGNSMDATEHGDYKKPTSMDAVGSKGGKYNLTPASQDKTQGKGKMSNNGKVHEYSESKDSNGGTVGTLSNVNPKGGPAKTYTCKGQNQQKAGTSSCVDQQGQKYGEVVQQPDGTVIVKKTIARGVDVPIGKATPVKGANGQPSYVTLNDGQFKAQCGNYRERDCMADYGKASSKIKIEKPMTVKFNSEKMEGTRRTFQFPDCVVMGAKVTLPPGMDASRLAVQVDANILPAGKLKCIDTGACRRDCYYCDLCNNTRKGNVAANSDTRNLCSAKGGGTYQITLTACPPPEAFDKDMCSGFTKSDPTYFKRAGDIQCKLLFWERPQNEQELKDKFYNTVVPNPILKNLILVDYKANNIIPASGNPNPTDFDLCQYYIKKNGQPDQLIGCTEGILNYTVSSQKVNTNFMLEAGSLATAPKSLIDTKPCPKVDAINQDEANKQKQESNARQPQGGAGNILQAFGGKFPGWPGGRR